MTNRSKSFEDFAFVRRSVSDHLTELRIPTLSHAWLVRSLKESRWGAHCSKELTSERRKHIFSLQLDVWLAKPSEKIPPSTPKKETMTIHKTSTGNDRKLVKRRKCDGIYENPYTYQVSHFNDNLPETIKVRKANNKPIGPCPENGGLMLTLMPSLVMQQTSTNREWTT